MSRLTDQIGRVLSGRYRLIAPLGTGASAQVYLADDVRLRRRVAVKILHAALADDETFLRRFRAEAQSAAALSHPNIVAVYDWGEDGGSPYIVTEHLGGGSLRSILDEGGRLTPSQALLVGLEATRALDYAHRRGFVHRDIKPANLLFGEDGRLRVADFGLARALAEAAWTEPQGAVMGTARYASPEQAQGESVDGKADVYSLGLVLVEAVTGTVPFTADTTIATLMARVGKPVPVPESLGPLRKPLLQAGLPDPADRPDAGALAIALMASAEALPRPEPLPLQRSAPVVDLSGHGNDATMLGLATGAAADLAPSRLAEAGDETSVDLTAVDQAPTRAGAPLAPPPVDDALVATDGPARSRRRWPVVLAVVLLAALLGTAAAWAVVASRPPRYEVPVLVGLSEDAARRAVDGYGWEIDRRTDRRDGSTPGEVLRTEPATGQQLEKGDTLVIWVSLGNELAAVPGDLVGKTLDDATAALQAAGGFVPKVVDEPFDESVPAGTVMAVAPETSGDQPKGSEVLLTVSKGPAPRTVPAGLVGGTFEQAKAALEGEQLKASKVEEFSDTVEKGRVMGLRPGEGQQVERGGTVEVVISKGPDIVSVPKVEGMTEDQAIDALQKAGLTVGQVTGPPGGHTAYVTDPPAGTTVKRGTTVTLYLKR
ncbi:MAG TPA: PASTA domain-containing protein [Acidimicrobiales bacterium]|nr:PASTA domain-containing protein [Acidimicrobiales bacterium]